MIYRHIPYYRDFLSDSFLANLLAEAKAVSGCPDLMQIGTIGGLENTESLRFVCQLYDRVRHDLGSVLTQRIKDRRFLDQRTRACFELNRKLGVDFSDSDYLTVLGQTDGDGRIVIGPKSSSFCRAGGNPIADLPNHLQGDHVTLFGPPDNAKLSINAMNAFHRKIKNEPPIISELLKDYVGFPKWGADDEDSKTPLREDLIAAGENLSGCFDGTLKITDSKRNYSLERDHLSLPIKRFPGLALPCSFLFYQNNPLPLHLYDFALHLFRNWKNEKALSFYVPKLENEEEAAYIHKMVSAAEQLIRERHPEYRLGSIRLFIVLENPRAILRVHEIMDALHPYFAGASLGWHDYLASTARLFKEDANYRIPVKADPDIVIKYIKASHELLAEVVGSRGGVKIGGMYGILPMSDDLASDSFQVTIKGFIKDVITQMKRDLSGYWVAHPDFVRIGLALVEAWRHHEGGDKIQLQTLVKALLSAKYSQEVLAFIEGPDVSGLDQSSPLYPRALLVADVKESTFIANNDSEEVRYNIFQSLQYLADWLSGNGCVALPAQIQGIPVRVMDDLATAERSRWEVWHEIHHGRVSLADFIRIAHEEMTFIRKDQSNDRKIVQVKWNDETARWYPIAFQLMLRLMTNPEPVEFASELLLPFTVDSIRNAQDPWQTLLRVDRQKYALNEQAERLDQYFSACGTTAFAVGMAANLAPDPALAARLIDSFNVSDLISAASFHGDIGEAKKTLDATATKEQQLVADGDAAIRSELQKLGEDYRKKFGVKFLISAKGKSAPELLQALKARIHNTREQELENAKTALWEIAVKRLVAEKKTDLRHEIDLIRRKYNVHGMTIGIARPNLAPHSMIFGERAKQAPVTCETWFELASLSKTLATAFALEYFKSRSISLATPVNELLAKTKSAFRLRHPQWGEAVTIEHLLNHTALNLHYVNGVPANDPMPKIEEFLTGNTTYQYPPIEVVHPPGTKFQYSGGGFLVLEHLLESLEKKPIAEITRSFFEKMGVHQISFVPTNLPETEYATGFLKNGDAVAGGRKMFPAFAAGAMGTAEDFCVFLGHLGRAYRNLDGSGPISHDTAVLMLHGRDLGSGAFMGAKMGLGVFTAVAGQNRLAIHQGANDGFRGLFVHCYDGPDAGKGFVILCNGDDNGVGMIADIAHLLFRHLRMQGISEHPLIKQMDLAKMKPEEIVNLSYKNLIFDAFLPDLPEAIVEKGPADPLAEYNLAVGAIPQAVTDQRFARAENLLSAYLPTFDPSLYGRQGKIMDSWETARHNALEYDQLEFQLRKPSRIRFVAISTQFHLGNQAEAIAIEGKTKSGQWQVIVDKLKLAGHAQKFVTIADDKTEFAEIRVKLYPDGGLTRLGLYADLPDFEKKKFAKPTQAESHPFREPIPHPKKPMAPLYTPAQKLKRPTADAIDLASEALGAKMIRASNEHYGSAARILSPFPPIDMFDGFESARSRNPNHSEEVIFALAEMAKVGRIEVDFTYFVNNNPREMKIEGLSKNGWIELVAKINVKAYAGNLIAFAIRSNELIEQIKLIVFPDGGLNRVHVYGTRSGN